MTESSTQSSTQSPEVAVIDLTNTTDAPLRVALMVGDAEYHIITLQPGQSTRQVTPSGVSWKFGPAIEGEGDGPGILPGEDGDVDKGEGSIH